MAHLKPLPITKDGFRYYWCEDDEALCSKYLKELNKSEANKCIYVKRKVIPPIVKLSENDRAPQLKLNEECTRVTGEKGYCMVRATHGINRGKFYFEVHIDSMPGNTASRIGWSHYHSNLQAPLGYDFYGYSWRSRFGTKFHQARGKSFDREGGYRENDTIGCMIELPYGNSKNLTQAHHLPTSVKKTGGIVQSKKKDQIPRAIEESIAPPPLNTMKPLPGSKISFYKNGNFVGVAFEDIFEGSYYPTISLYKSCTVSVNFGPKFKYPPEKFNDDNKNHVNYKPAQDMAEILVIDNFLSDLLCILELELTADGKTVLDDLVKNPVQGQH